MKRICTWICCIMALLCLLPIPARAAEKLDLNSKGSISLTMTYKGKAVPGGKLTVYPVARLVEDGSSGYAYEAIGSYRYGPELTDVTSAKLAKSLADFTKEQKLEGTEVKIGDTGGAGIGQLPLGLYLVVQTEPAKGYSAIDPFLVSVPIQTATGGYDLSVDATPKMGVEPEPTKETTPTTSTKKPTSSSSSSKGSRLPQTGMNNWPVPVLALLGLISFLFGWLLVRSGRKDRYES